MMKKIKFLLTVSVITTLFFPLGGIVPLILSILSYQDAKCDKLDKEIQRKRTVWSILLLILSLFSVVYGCMRIVPFIHSALHS